MFVMSNEISAG